jgi:hypothetical protein
MQPNKPRSVWSRPLPLFLVALLVGGMGLVNFSRAATRAESISAVIEVLGGVVGIWLASRAARGLELGPDRGPDSTRHRRLTPRGRRKLLIESIFGVLITSPILYYAIWGQGPTRFGRILIGSFGALMGFVTLLSFYRVARAPSAE